MNLLNHIERYLRRNPRSATRLGREAMNDPSFVRQLRNGREPRRETVDRVRAWLEANDRAPGGRGCGK
jgi:hypothetical protein